MNTLNDNLAKTIAQSIIDADFQQLLSYLSPDGMFEIQDESLRNVTVSPIEFVLWIAKRRVQYAAISHIHFELLSCNQTNKKHPVIWFNNGRFPFVPWYSNAGMFYGLRIISNSQGQASEIIFCDHSNHIHQNTFYNTIIPFIDEAEISDEEDIIAFSLNFLKEESAYPATAAIGGWEETLFFNQKNNNANTEWDPDAVPF